MPVFTVNVNPSDIVFARSDKVETWHHSVMLAPTFRCRVFGLTLACYMLAHSHFGLFTRSLTAEDKANSCYVSRKGESQSLPCCQHSGSCNVDAVGSLCAPVVVVVSLPRLLLCQ